jgi:phosphate transport system permease protein
MPVANAKHAARQRGGELFFRAATLTAALLVLALLGGVALALLIGAWPALAHFKFGFLTHELWNPVTDQFGALAAIYGTLMTAFIAMLLAVPVGFGIAVFLTELCPRGLRRPVGLQSSSSPPFPASFLASGGFSFSRPFCKRTCSRGSSRTSARCPASGISFRVRHLVSGC